MFHDAVYGGQSEARTFPLLLSREKRFEDARSGYLIHTDTGVVDGQSDVATRRNRVAVGSQAPLHLGGLRPNRELPALRHGIARVHGQVHHDLAHFHGVGPGIGQLGIQLGQQLDVLTDDAAHLADVGPAQALQLAGGH